jgi:hypothetical protein
MPYQDALSTIRGDLLAIEQHEQEFTSTSELKLTEALLATLESKLKAFKQILPKLNPRRGLMDLGGSVLKALFGTAVISYITSLYGVFDELQSSQNDVIHSVTNQLIYIKRLDTITNVNVQAIANLSGIIKDTVINSHERFRQTARDIIWLNLTIHGQSTLFTTIRQLEFTILRITQQLNELMNAVQHATLGKLPMTLVDPVTLHSILKNISLSLPDGYDLVAGTKFENVHLYYDCTQTAIIGDPQHIKMILSVPLKTVNRHFVLYKILALPTRIFNSAFIQYLPDFLYFGIDHIQRNYILLTEVEFSYCTRGSLAICSANKAIYSSQMITCETSLFFQKTDSLELCRRRLLLHHTTPLLQRYDTALIYHFPENQQVVLRSWENGTWISTSNS